MYLVVGSGLSGAVLAERLAASGKSVLVIEKRDHIGGNCYDYEEKETGIRVSKYGAHLFHTNSERVWEYVNRFADWVRWEHKVLSAVQGRLVSVPVNITTVNELCGQHLQTAEEMREYMQGVQISNTCPRNSEEMALSRVGPRLYEALFKPYTVKQWGKEPAELDPSVLARIPIRYDFDTRYFSDKYQGLPAQGYTAFVTKMLEHPLITVKVSTDFEAYRDRISEFEAVFFTGPIDEYFQGQGHEKLEYRSIEFTQTILKDTPFFQPASVVNYPGLEVPFTRIVEYKHFLHQSSPHTILVSETTKDAGEPYYPVPTERNRALYETYRKLAEEEERKRRVYFVGRLANYKYFNMDQAIENALNVFDIFSASYPKDDSPIF